MKVKSLKTRVLGFSRAALLGGLATAALAGAPGIAAAKDSVTVSVVLALAAGEWSTEILAGANAAAKDLGGKVNVRVTGPTTFDPQRQAQMFLAELETKPDVLVVVNVAPPLFTQPALDAQARGANIVWINVPPMPEIKNALFVASDAYGMGLTGGEIVVAALEKAHNKPAAEITGDVVTAVCVPGLTVLENRLAGEVAYLKKKMPKINVLASFDSKPDRERNFALWDQAIRKTPKALTYIDPCEEGEENIPKILENDKVKVPLVSYDSPEEVREDVVARTDHRGGAGKLLLAGLSRDLHRRRLAAEGQALASRLGEGSACGRGQEQHRRLPEGMGEARVRVARFLQRADRGDARPPAGHLAGSGLVYPSGAVTLVRGPLRLSGPYVFV